MNVYSYVSNTPVMRADPLGLWDALFTNMPGVQERASLGTHMMNNGESPEAVARAMAPPPPKPIATGECKASGALAVGAGLAGHVAINEESGMSKWGSFQTSAVAARASLSCGLKFSSSGKALPVAGGIALGLGFLNLEITQASSWPDIYMGIGPSIGPEFKAPMNPSVNIQF
ncbi:hypothetical protein [Pseudomonas sichuanensis]|uniref:hypothetical protein n=1 Tax=Pseudomonas TaxID=286 RepID=UPI0036EE6330